MDDDIDNVLGLAVFYQYVRTAELNQRQQTKHVSVFTTELFAHYLLNRCQSVMMCGNLTAGGKKLYMSAFHSQRPCVSDVLSLKLMNSEHQDSHHEPLASHCQNFAARVTELDASNLVELLQQFAVEHLTTYRQLQAQKFGAVATIVTTDFEALYAYKRGDYQRCLQLSTQNSRTLLYADYMTVVYTYPEFIQLLDDDIVSLTALTIFVDPAYKLRDNCRDDDRFITVTQLTLSLYLMTQCQLKLHHSVTSLAMALVYVKVARRRTPVDWTLDSLTLKLTERKIISHLTSAMR